MVVELPVLVTVEPPRTVKADALPSKASAPASPASRTAPASPASSRSAASSPESSKSPASSPESSKSPASSEPEDELLPVAVEDDVLVAPPPDELLALVPLLLVVAFVLEVDAPPLPPPPADVPQPAAGSAAKGTKSKPAYNFLSIGVLRGPGIERPCRAASRLRRRSCRIRTRRSEQGSRQAVGAGNVERDAGIAPSSWQSATGVAAMCPRASRETRAIPAGTPAARPVLSRPDANGERDRSSAGSKAKAPLVEAHLSGDRS